MKNQNWQVKQNSSLEIDKKNQVRNLTGTELSKLLVEELNDVRGGSRDSGTPETYTDCLQF